MPTNQEARQASVRAVTGSNYFYDDDWRALFDQAGVAPGFFNERLLRWINGQLSASFVNINDAMRAFAISQGAPSWSEMGTFTAGTTSVLASSTSVLASSGSVLASAG